MAKPLPSTTTLQPTPPLPECLTLLQLQHLQPEIGNNGEGVWEGGRERGQCRRQQSRVKQAEKEERETV